MTYSIISIIVKSDLTSACRFHLAGSASDSRYSMSYGMPYPVSHEIKNFASNLDKSSISETSQFSFFLFVHKSILLMISAFG